MVSYNREKIRANRIIDVMYLNDKSINKIYFKINTLFGFGKKVVNDRIELIELNKKEDLKKDGCKETN